MKLKITLILVLVFVLFGCATPYQPVGDSGGYTYERISEDVFAVNFHGNGFTSDKRVRDFCLLRCAEITTEFRFKYFTIEGEDRGRDRGNFFTRFFDHLNASYMGRNYEADQLALDQAYARPREQFESSSTTTTTGTLNTFGNTGYYNSTSITTPNKMYVYKPGITYVIRCYDQEPTEGHFSRLYNAIQVADELSTKYKINND